MKLSPVRSSLGCREPGQIGRVSKLQFAAGALLLAAWFGQIVRAGEASLPAPTHTTILFNGRDLEGWETLLGPRKPGDTPLGRNNDPDRVFSVVQEDGAPAIRVSGQVWGALVSVREFENYHLHAQFKWGKLKWPPRQEAVRDSGILYHCVGEPDPHTGWMRSFECQIEEHDCGDFWSVRNAVAFAETRRMDITPELRQEFAVWCRRNEGQYPPFAYWPGGPRMRIDKDGLMKQGDAEKPLGQWNDVDIYCTASNSLHVINGQTNMVLWNLSQTGPNGTLTPLRRGKIQLQSEGAEIFFRAVELQALK
jgi:hypothetical protein